MLICIDSGFILKRCMVHERFKKRGDTTNDSGCKKAILALRVRAFGKRKPFSSISKPTMRESGTSQFNMNTGTSATIKVVALTRRRLRLLNRRPNCRHFFSGNGSFMK